MPGGTLPRHPGPRRPHPPHRLGRLTGQQIKEHQRIPDNGTTDLGAPVLTRPQVAHVCWPAIRLPAALTWCAATACSCTWLTPGRCSLSHHLPSRADSREDLSDRLTAPGATPGSGRGRSVQRPPRSWRLLRRERRPRRAIGIGVAGDAARSAHMYRGDSMKAAGEHEERQYVDSHCGREVNCADAEAHSR